jgi:flagellar biosynthesis protein FlhF
MEQTKVHTYRAENMQSALDLVRRELGADAVILHTRQLPKSTWRFWGQRRETVEITAGTGVNVRTPRVAAVPRRTPVAATAPSPVATVSPAPVRRTPWGEGGLSLETPDLDLPERVAPRDPAPVSRSAPERTVPRRPALDRAILEQNVTDQDTYSAGAVPRGVQPSLSSRSVPVTGYAPLPEPTTAAPRVTVDHATREAQASLQRQLDSIRRMVEGLSRGALSQREEIPADLFQIYTQLIDAEVDEELARELICRLRDATGTGTTDPLHCRRQLSTMVEADLRCGGPIAVTPGRRKVVALVGPTGVGKTTTIAKLAANFRLRDGIRMGLVTVDTYRIAAVEQLRTYAEIIDLPMKVVTSPNEMSRALSELRGMDLVLIDTAGRSPKDEPRIQELRQLLDEAQVDETHLVLSLTSSTKSLEAGVDKFAAAGVTSLILTKLDEALGMGGLLSIARRVPLPISYVTTGQDVPDDIETASARRLSRLILGEDRLVPRRAG